MYIPETAKTLPAIEPVYRCHNCQQIIYYATISNEGKCPHCGGRRVRSLCALSPEEHEQVVAWGVSQEFLDTFKAVQS